MSEKPNPNDPAGTTQQFRAFVSKGQGQPEKTGVNVGLIVGIAAVVLVLAVALGVAFLL